MPLNPGLNGSVPFIRTASRLQAFDVGNAFLGGRLIIAEEVISVYGQGTFDPARFPPRFGPPSFGRLELCGQEGAAHAISCDAIRAGIESGYVLTLVAAPRS